MPVHVSWDNQEKTVIHLKFEGNWTWEEVYHAVDNRNGMIDEVDHKVDIMVDFEAASMRVPPSAITHTRSIMRQAHDLIDLNVIVGFKSGHKALWGIIEKVYATLGKYQKYFVAPSLGEAREMLAERRQKQ